MTQLDKLIDIQHSYLYRFHLFSTSLESMEKDYALILELLDLKDDEGVHWYKFDRLMMLTGEPLAGHEYISQVVRELSDLGLLKVIKDKSPLSGNCVISDQGKKWLTDRNYSGSLARSILSTLAEKYQITLY